MKRRTAIFALLLLLGVSSQKAAQIAAPKIEQAVEAADKLQQSIKIKEPKWKLKDSFRGSLDATQVWRSGKHQIELSIYEWRSPEEASEKLQQSARISSVSSPHTLNGMGDEAYYRTHRFFGWVGVRKGELFVTVHAPTLDQAKRFAQYALEQLEAQSQ